MDQVLAILSMMEDRWKEEEASPMMEVGFTINMVVLLGPKIVGV